MQQSDLVVIGGGIVGLATAYQFTLRYPGRSVTVLEKEPAVALHQTGRNSGVIHSGIYYKPGSLKATNCREGKVALEAFCESEGVPYEVCGKVIVAVDDSELPALEKIHERGIANEVPCEMIDADRLAELEPHVRGVRALHVHSTGIVDYVGFCHRLVERIQQAGGQVITSTKVLGFAQHASGEFIVESSRGSYAAKVAVNCAGLYCDRVAKLTGKDPGAKIVPFRGEYFTLKDSAKHLVSDLIYPVPDPAFPFLGVHFTRMIDGAIECGPNAVLAFAREGYGKTQVDIAELAESLTYAGFLRIAMKYWKTGAGEMWRSFSKRAFVKALQRLVPDIQESDLVAAPAGVRAQAVLPDGTLVDDFLIKEEGRLINVLNAPSPAATASLNIGNLVVDRIADHLS